MAKKNRTSEGGTVKVSKKTSKRADTTKTIEQKVRENSPFKRITTSLYLSLSPCANNFPLDGLCGEHLSPHLLSYYPPLNGVLLSYENVRLSASPEDALRSDGPSDVLARSISEYAVTFVWLTADFLVFRPSPGTYLQAEVNLQDEGVLGLIVYNYFNIAIPRENLPPDWNWDGEKWVNEKGGIEKDIVCKVVDFEPSGQESISITGTLVGI